MGGERLIRILPRPDEDLMSDAITDKTRFGWEAMYNNRLTQIRVSKAGKTVSTDASELSLHVVSNSNTFKPRLSALSVGPLNV